MLRSASLSYELENSKKCYINIMVRSHMFSNFIRSCNLFICYPIHKETFLRHIQYWYYIRRFCFVKLIFHATTNSTKFLITLSLAGDKFVVSLYFTSIIIAPCLQQTMYQIRSLPYGKSIPTIVIIENNVRSCRVEIRS